MFARTNYNPMTPPTVVTIADNRYVLPVYVLLVSLKYHRVRCLTHVLGVELSPDNKSLLDQFEDTWVFDADPSNGRNPATRKGEALLTAKHTTSEWVVLMDGDCIATGDISEYLNPTTPGLMSRQKSPAEDAECFRKHYAPNETPGGVPAQIREIWRQDVHQRSTPRHQNTVIGGNLALHRNHLWFAYRWQEQMSQVLPTIRTAEAYDYDSIGYFQLDESVLNSLLMFDEDAPPLVDYTLNQDPAAYLAHLGPGKPRYWEGWRFDRLQYYKPIMEMLAWARSQGYRMPELPWTLQPANRPFVYAAAWKNRAREAARAVAAPVYHSLKDGLTRTH